MQQVRRRGRSRFKARVGEIDWRRSTKSRPSLKSRSSRCGRCLHARASAPPAFPAASRSSTSSPRPTSRPASARSRGRSGCQGRTRSTLKALLKDMADEGLIDSSPGRAFHQAGGVPKVTVLRVADGRRQRHVSGRCRSNGMRKRRRRGCACMERGQARRARHRRPRARADRGAGARAGSPTR